jgi:hypothetical protein
LKDSVLKEIDTLIAEQPLLKVSAANEDVLISGKYKICNQVDDEVFEDYFALEIHVPNDFPDTLPRIKTADSRIRAINYKEHVYPDGTFCLETDTAIAAYLQETQSLLGFLSKYLDTYLCGFLYYRKHKKLPFGERRHGGLGLLDYYCELFETSNVKEAFALLDCLVKRNLKGHIQCPCQSGMRYRNCHRQRINELKEAGLFERYKADYNAIISEVNRNVENKSKNAR